MTLRNFLEFLVPSESSRVETTSSAGGPLPPQSGSHHAESGVCTYFVHVFEDQNEPIRINRDQLGVKSLGFSERSLILFGVTLPSHGGSDEFALESDLSTCVNFVSSGSAKS